MKQPCENQFRAKPLERKRAIALRKLGLSYSEIRSQISVAKATLSVWFRNVGLSKRQIQRLTAKKLAAGRRGARLLHEQGIRRTRQIHRDAHREAKRLIKTREVRWAIGTALYWAEGAKIKKSGRLVFTNTDPRMILFFRRWLRQYCLVTTADLDYSLYIHENADIIAARKFWTERLGIQESELHTYLKKHNPATNRHYDAQAYYGTLRLLVRQSTALGHRVTGWIHAMAQYL